MLNHPAATVAERIWSRSSVQALVVARAAAMLALALFASMSIAGVASAAPKSVVGTFGSSGAGTGQFGTGSSGVGGVAVNQTTGELFVVDRGNNRVQRFDADGTYLSHFGSVGATGGLFSAPQGVAIDPADGAVYVTDQTNRRVQKFDSTGAFLFAFGWDVTVGGVTTFEVCAVAASCKVGTTGAGAGQFGAAIGHPTVNPSNGDVYVPDATNRRVQVFSSTGAFLRAFGWNVDPAGGGGQFEVCTVTCQASVAGSGPGQFATSSPTRVAIDSGGNIYAVDNGNTRVQKFSSTPSPVAVFASAQLSGAPTPTDVVVNPVNDRVLVVKPSATPAERRILEFDSGGTLLDTHMAGAGINSVNGLGYNNASGRIYASSTTGAQRVFKVDVPLAAPTLVVDPATGVTATGATFNGSVNPNGTGAANELSTSYHFEYSTNGVNWTNVPATDVDVGSGNVSVPVSQAVSGLAPNTNYQVRLVATRPFGGGGATSATQIVTTSALAPTVSDTGSFAVGDTEAGVRGKVNPNNAATTYHFEYGTDTNYGSTTSVGDLEAGTSPVAVFATLTGLEPNTTYHFRLVATNATDTTEGPDATFTTLPAAPPDPGCANAALRLGPSKLLAGCRAYELVSPPNKDGGEMKTQLSAASGRTDPLAVSEDGQVKQMMSLGVFAGQTWGGNSNGTDYLARRTDSGWATDPITPMPVDGRAEVALGQYSSDLSKARLGTPAPLMTGEGAGTYIQDNATGALTHVYDSGTLFGSVGSIVNRDLSHVAFGSQLVLTTDPGVPAGTTKIYDWTTSGYELVSFGPDETPLAASAKMGDYRIGGSSRFSGNAISNDGSRIYFSSPTNVATAPPANVQIYMRDNGSETVLVTPSKRTDCAGDVTCGGDGLPNPAPDPLGAKGKRFLIASPNGERVFFVSAEHLTDNANTGPTRAGNDLYRYEADTDELINISAEVNDANGAQVQGIAGISEDGDDVYYVGLGRVVTGEGTAGSPNLYHWHDDGTATGETRFIATLDSADARIWAPLFTEVTAARVTPSGNQLAFQSVANLTGYAGGGTSQIFRYDATAAGGAGQLDCVSCRSTGVSPEGPSIMPLTRSTRTGADLSQVMTSDGSRVFFDSEDAIDPRDTNEVMDVYMWENGRVSLLSTGRDSSPSQFDGSSLSGDDVFILTREALVGQDVDGSYDIYDVRVGGGFPAPVVQTPCAGDDCQGPQSSPPDAPGEPGSSVLELPPESDTTPSSPRPPVALALPRAARDRLARGKAAALRVRAGGAGTVRVVARARIGGRTRSIGRGRAKAPRAGTVRVKFRVSRAARRALSKRGKLTVTLVVRASGTSATDVIRVQLKSPEGKR